MILALFRGGRLSRIADHSFRLAWLIVLAFSLQLVLFVLEGRVEGIETWSGLIFIFSYLLLFPAVLANWKVKGMPWAGVGMFLNFVAIAANGGKMPVSTWGLRYSGQEKLLASLREGAGVMHALVTENTRLWFLGDVLVFPRPYPLPTVFSVGDLLLLIGLFLLVQHLMGVPIKGSRFELESGL